VEREQEVVEKRTLTSKTFLIAPGRFRRVHHEKPVHYEDDNSNLKTIDITIREEDDKFIVDKNRFSAGFRKDGKREKYFGLRKGYGNQLEATISRIILNGEEVIFERFQKIEKINDYELKHVIYDGLWIHNRIHETHVRESLVVETDKISLKDVEVWYELHVKGFKYKGKKADGFIFEISPGDKVWIPKPLMWLEGHDHEAQGLVHKIVKKDGKLFYVKYLDDKAKNWIYAVQKFGLTDGDYQRQNIKKNIYIDSTTYYATSEDGDIRGSLSATWSTAMSTGSSISASTTAIRVNTYASNEKSGTKYQIRRGFLYFDTSGLPDNATITSAEVSVYEYTWNDSTSFVIQKGTQSSSLSSSDFAAYSGNHYGTITNSGSAKWHTFTLDSQGRADISLTGTTKYCIREYNYDYQDTPPDPGSLTVKTYGTYFYASENSGTTYDPKLVIDYTMSQNLSETIAYDGYSSVSVAAGKILSDTLPTTCTGIISITLGASYHATAICTVSGTPALIQNTSYISLVSYTSYATSVQQDIDYDLELITAASLSSFTETTTSSYSKIIEYPSYGQLDYAGPALFAPSIGIKSLATVTQQDIDTDIEIILLQTTSSITAVWNISCTLEIVYAGAGSCSITAGILESVEILFGSSCCIDASRKTAFQDTADFICFCTVVQQDEDTLIETVAMAGESLAILTATIAYNLTYDYPITKSHFSISTNIQKTAEVGCLAASSIHTISAASYGIAVSVEALVTALQQDIDYDIEIILCGSSGNSWMQDIEILKILGTGTPSVATIGHYSKEMLFYVNGAIEALALKTWTDNVIFKASSLFGINTNCNYTNHIECTGYGTVTVLDVDIDIEFITFTAYGSLEVIPAYLPTIEIKSAAYFSIDSSSTGKTVLFWSIEADGVILEDNYDLEYAKFTDEKGKQSDSFEIVLDNRDGKISDRFEVGSDVYLFLDENDPPKTKVFHGLVTGIDFEIDLWGHNKLILSGEDYGSVRLGQTIISGAENYSNTTATDIIADIILRYCPEITTNNLESFTEQIPYISFAWEYLSQAIDKIARLVGADYYVDEDDDLHFYDPSDLLASHSLTSSHILNAKIKKDSSKFFDRVFVIGGKQGFLDQSQVTATTEVSLHDKHYASSFTPSKTNCLYIEAYIKKIGNPLDAFKFMVVEDNSGPTGAIAGFGSIPAKNISTDGSWVKSDYIDVQLDMTKLHWIVFKKCGTSTDTYKVAHDDTTANGHKYSENGSSWTAAKGKCAFKTYYGVQVVKGASGTKMFDNHTDIPIVDFSIKDTDTALMLAQQKIIEYALKNASKLEINPPGKRMKAGEVVSVSIPGVTLEDQTILSVSYEITDPHIAKVRLECTAAEDFYSAFSNLFAELRRLKVENVLQSQETSTDYKETTETESVALTETITESLAGYKAKFDDGKSKWDVSKWT